MRGNWHAALSNHDGLHTTSLHVHLLASGEASWRMGSLHVGQIVDPRWYKQAHAKTHMQTDVNGYCIKSVTWRNLKMCLGVESWGER